MSGQVGRVKDQEEASIRCVPAVTQSQPRLIMKFLAGARGLESTALVAAAGLIIVGGRDVVIFCC